MAAFTDEEIVAIRRQAGYPAASASLTDVIGPRLTALSQPEGRVIIDRFLPILVQLERDVDEVRGNLDTAEAAVWKRNPQELLERAALYRSRRIALCRFLGIEPGAAIFDAMLIDPCGCDTGSGTGGTDGGVIPPGSTTALPPAVLVV